MLWLIIIILIVGWLLGFFVFNLGSLLHILLVVAVVILIVNLLRGRPAV
ncbi:MAG TPA: lmo0937 family membrane protein [Rhodothermales bacterium]